MKSGAEHISGICRTTWYLIHGQGYTKAYPSREKTMPNVDSSLWNKRNQNQTYTFAKNIMKNVDYYKRPIRTDRPPPVQDDFHRYERANNKAKLNPLAGDDMRVDVEEIRALGRKNKVVDYVEDTQLVDVPVSEVGRGITPANLLGREEVFASHRPLGGVPADGLTTRPLALVAEWLHRKTSTSGFVIPSPAWCYALPGLLVVSRSLRMAHSAPPHGWTSFLPDLKARNGF